MNENGGDNVFRLRHFIESDFDGIFLFIFENCSFIAYISECAFFQKSFWCDHHKFIVLKIEIKKWKRFLSMWHNTHIELK